MKTKISQPRTKLWVGEIARRMADNGFVLKAHTNSQYFGAQVFSVELRPIPYYQKMKGISDPQHHELYLFRLPIEGNFLKAQTPYELMCSVREGLFLETPDNTLVTFIFERDNSVYPIINKRNHEKGVFLCHEKGGFCLPLEFMDYFGEEHNQSRSFEPRRFIDDLVAYAIKYKK